MTMTNAIRMAMITTRRKQMFVGVVEVSGCKWKDYSNLRRKLIYEKLKYIERLRY